MQSLQGTRSCRSGRSCSTAISPDVPKALVLTPSIVQSQDHVGADTEQFLLRCSRCSRENAHPAGCPRGWDGSSSLEYLPMEQNKNHGHLTCGSMDMVSGGHEAAGHLRTLRSLNTLFSHLSSRSEHSGLCAPGTTGRHGW